MLGPFLDTRGVSGKMTDNMGSHSYRLRVCDIDIKSREIDVWVWESSEKGAFEAVKCKGPGTRLIRENWHGLLALALQSSLFWDPLEYGGVSVLIPGTSTWGQLLCPLCLVYHTGQG